MAVTLKVEAELFIDPDYFNLTDRQKFILFAVLCHASDFEPVSIKKIEFLIREKVGSQLKMLENTGFITVHGEFISPTGKLAHRFVTTGYSKARRQKERAQKSPNPPQNQPAPVYHAPTPAPQTPAASFDDWDAPLEDSQPQAIQLPSPALEAPKPTPAPKKKRAKPSEHDEGVREKMITDGLDEKTADDLLEHRTKKKAPLTFRAWEDITKEAKRAQWPLIAAVEKLLAKGWASFEAAWVANLPKPDVNFVTTSPAFGNAAAQIEQDGMVKNNFGQWRKRNGGVCL